MGTVKKVVHWYAMTWVWTLAMLPVVGVLIWAFGMKAFWPATIAVCLFAISKKTTGR